MFEEFSAGYYIGQLCVEPYDGTHAVMDSDQHVAANEQVYDTGGPIERRDHPLVMKIEQCYVPVFGTDDLARDTLGLPEAVLASTRINTPPTVKDVLVAKAERAAQLLEWATLYTIREPDVT
jgi:hypothetical protein